MGCGSSKYSPQVVQTATRLAPPPPPLSMARPQTVVPTVMVQPPSVAQLQGYGTSTMNETVPITEESIQDFQALSVVINGLEEGNVLGRLDAAMLRQSEFQREIEALNQYYNELTEKMQKEHQDVSKLKSVAQAGSISKYFASQSDFDQQISKEEVEFLQAKADQENCYDHLVKLQEQNSKLSAEIDELKLNKNELMTHYKEQDELLEKIFGGTYGSSMEDQLEEELDRIENKHRTIKAAIERWRKGEVFVKTATDQLRYATKRFEDAMRIPREADTYNIRHLAITEARNSLIPASRNLATAQRYIHPVKFPYCDASELSTLTSAINYIYIDGCQGMDRQQHALQVYATVAVRSSMLQQWIKNVIDQRIAKDLQEVRVKSLECRQALRNERLRLMKEKVRETTGKEISIQDTEIFDSFIISDDEEHQALAEVAEAEKMEDAADLDDKIEEAKTGNNEDRVDGVVASSNALKSSPDHLAPAPSRNELFGDLDTIMAAYDQQRQALQQEQDFARARQEANVKEKLRRRRSMKTRLEAQEALRAA